MQTVHVALGFCIKTSADCSVRRRPGSEAWKWLRPHDGKEAGPLQPLEKRRAGRGWTHQKVVGWHQAPKTALEPGWQTPVPPPSMELGDGDTPVCDTCSPCDRWKRRPASGGPCDHGAAPRGDAAAAEAALSRKVPEPFTWQIAGLTPTAFCRVLLLGTAL